jgi:hypothetical protein
MREYEMMIEEQVKRESHGKSESKPVTGNERYKQRFGIRVAEF